MKTLTRAEEEIMKKALSAKQSARFSRTILFNGIISTSATTEIRKR